MQVSLADGKSICSYQQIQGLKWWTQGCTFETDVRVLQLGCNDMILGMEWLEEQGPMWIHWKRKKLRFVQNGKRITLHGVKDITNICHKISTKRLQGLVRQGGLAQLVQLASIENGSRPEVVPPAVQTLLQDHASLFQEPSGLPPHRSFDHSILLLPGAKPVNIRPYRYSPKQKDEIEKQIKDMLKQGVIQPSSTPFASPVLLVKKKDVTWRFCVDYRQLNAATVKNKYHLPIIDELLDELHGAKWFTKLDLRARYHQIRLVKEDEFI